VKLEFSRNIFEKIQKYKISCKFVQWEPMSCIQAEGRKDGRTDMTKIIVARLYLWRQLGTYYYIYSTVHALC